MKSKALLAILFLLAPAWRLSAQAEHEDPVVYADHKSIGEEALRAEGHVEILWQDYIIYADAVDFNLKSRELFAQGRVTMASQDMVLSGEKLVFNLKTQKGELLDTFGLMSPVVRYETDRLVQTDRETLTFQRLKLSSCAQIFPRWRITGRRGRIKKDKYVEMSDVLLRIKSVPVLYLPYMRYPLKPDGRATGLLMPGLGLSGLKGSYIQNQFFWAIRPNVDMSLGLDYYSKLGTGVSDELRYLFRNASGSARFYYFKYRPDNGTYNDTDHDYYVEASHQQTLPFLNTRLVLNVNRQSRIGFLRLLDNSFDISRSANFQSTLSLTSSFANMSVSLKASHTETYDIINNTNLIMEYLPSLNFNLNQQKVWKLPGYFSLDAGLQRVRRSGVTYEEEVQYVNDVLSQRLTVTPSYQLPLFRLSWLNSSLALASKNAFYAKSRDPKTKEILDEPLHLKYQTASFTLQGPILSRVFASGGGKLMHVIEPRFDVQYSTKADNRDRLIPVDRFDNPSYSYAGFSLTTRLLRKGASDKGSPSELASYTVSEQYYFDPAEANNYLKIDGEYPRFSQMSHALRLRPGGDFLFDASLAYNFYIHGLANLNLSASYSRAGSPLTGSLVYSIYRSPYFGENYKGNRSNLGCRLNFAASGFPLKLQSRVDYDFQYKRLMYSSLDLAFDYQCLMFTSEFKVFWYGDGYHFQYRFGVSLGNLGAVSDFFGGK
jgi:LPS-assembly protein